MGLVYRSPRQTADIDFTADIAPTKTLEDELSSALDPELRRAAARLGYPQLVCCVQRTKRRPRPTHFAEANFPALDITVAYANRDTPAHERMRRGECPTTLKMEVSFREPVHAITFVSFGAGGTGLHAYSLIDLISEKLRALLQQSPRRRNRRQDIYDIDYLIRELPPSPEEEQEILAALLTKARARNLEPTPDGLADPTVKQRSAAHWDTLQLEVATLPDFDTAYERVERFYRSLPWSSRPQGPTATENT